MAVEKLEKILEIPKLIAYTRILNDVTTYINRFYCVPLAQLSVRLYLFNDANQIVAILHANHMIMLTCQLS